MSHYKLNISIENIDEKRLFVYLGDLDIQKKYNTVLEVAEAYARLPKDSHGTDPLHVLALEVRWDDLSMVHITQTEDIKELQVHLEQARTGSEAKKLARYKLFELCLKDKKYKRAIGYYNEMPQSEFSFRRKMAAAILTYKSEMLK
jgi:hypothetical protein